LKERRNKPKKIAFFGHFGTGNLGNEATLQAMLYNLRSRLPDAEVTCICTFPEVAAATYGISAVPISSVFVKPWNIRNPLARWMRKVLIGIPSELYRWLRAFWTLKGKDMFIVPGTGLLTDAYGLLGWGPYNMFKWSLTAKLCGCKLLFVSVGAGPIYGTFARWLVKSALSLADFRSYRDKSSLTYLKGIGFQTNNDRVYPDLAFSLPEAVTPQNGRLERRRPVVGIGLMVYAGRYSVDRPSHRVYAAYLENLAIFAGWLLVRAYDVRLLIGEIGDKGVKQEFKGLLRERSIIYDETRIKDEPVSSFQQLFSQIAATDFVVATRFHNLVFSLILKKPVMAVSFHHKCLSLMKSVGLPKYCQDINDLDSHSLTERFCDLEKNADKVRAIIKDRTEPFRKALNEQYNSIL
jgi:polysaccharide pyruvyl transferase WcaK-like protein